MKAHRWLGIALLVAACGGEEAPPPEAGNKPQDDAAEPSSTATAQGGAPKKRGDRGNEHVEEAPLLNVSPDDFVESDKSRDPFRDYSSLFRKPTNTGDTGGVDRKVKAPKFALDELKLVGIITRSGGRAMLVDPNGFGWILYTGDFVGKAESVSTGGTEGQEVQVNWRVDRIQPTDVTFVREDSLHPQVGRSTRKMPLYPAGESTGRGS